MGVVTVPRHRRRAASREHRRRFPLAYDDGSAANGQIEVRTTEAQIVVHLDVALAAPPDRWNEVAEVIARLNAFLWATSN